LLQNRLIRVRQMLARKHDPRQSSNKPSVVSQEEKKEKGTPHKGPLPPSLPPRDAPVRSKKRLSIEHMLLQPRSAPYWVLHADECRGSCTHTIPFPSTRCMSPDFHNCVGKDTQKRCTIGKMHKLERHPFSEPLTSTGGLLHIP